MRLYLAIPLFLFFLSPAASLAGKVHFNPYWTLKMKTGQSIDIVSLETDYDSTNQLLLIYTTQSGEESFGSENLSNAEELVEILEKNAPDNDLNKSSSYKSTTPPSSQKEYTASNQSNRYSKSPDLGAADWVNFINMNYGKVCSASLSGFFSKTLKIDWTSSTTKLHAIKGLRKSAI